MKNLLLICFLITFQYSFGQSESVLKVNLFKKNKITSLYNLNNKSSLIQYDEIIQIDDKLIKNTTENKFSFDSKNITSKEAASIIKISDDSKKVSFDSNLTDELKKEFIYEVIAKELSELKKIELQNENIAKSYGDRNIELYRNYDLLENKLIKSLKLNSDLELQLGSSVMPFIRKTNKSEIDKTLNNSLNLFAINF